MVNMGVFKPPVGTNAPLSNNALALNGKSEDQLSVATATNADKLDNLDASDFATTGDIPTDYGDVTGPEGATAGNFPILDVTGKILSDSTYAPSDFATTNHLHIGVYEPIISPKNSAFNVNFGTDHTTAAYGDHTNTGYVAISDYEDLDVLNKIKNVDGYGSGLDADLWQGYTPENITISNAYNATQLDGEYSYVYKNVIIFDGIYNTPPETYYEVTYMVGMSPSGDFAEFPFGTIVRYNGTSWDVIGNV